MFYYFTKVITAGNHIRTIEASKPIDAGYNITRKVSSKRSEGEKRFDNQRRTQDLLVLTIDANVNSYSKFLTLTFKNPCIDRTEAMKHFNLFRKNFKRQFSENIKYIAVTERQLERGITEGNEGSWHFHLVVFNSKKLDFHLLKKSWPYGSVDIKLVDSVDNLGRYLGKYLSKQKNGIKLNEKSVIKSQGLNEPTIQYDTKLNPSALKTYTAKYDYVNKDSGEVLSFTQIDYTIKKGDIANEKN